ncbi:L,D-transpeptidase [Nitriliruptor alkaliphilus]|uniref:L,D-transpeptidase n=1 Tax=Nitriliruptor alkaliphilus TaxID=427918 RepID=UPI0009F898C8|nr:L,D-transpeptidase [Nitriliruptor alkaliphilus]
MRTTARTLLAASLAALTLTACTVTTEPPPDSTAPPSTAPTTDAPTPPTDEPAVADEVPVTSATLIGRARGDLTIHDAPGGEVSHELPGTTPFGSTTTLLVLDHDTGPDAGWLQVAVPVRPNGTTGFVREEAVLLERTDLEVLIDTAARELTVRDGDEVLLTAPTAIGEPANPTPLGRFWLTDKVASDDPEGPYGPFALGLSARSETLTEFAGGDGQIAIHGTNQPGSIGQAVSHGCLRVTDEVVEALVELLPLGAPVTIS